MAEAVFLEAVVGGALSELFRAIKNASTRACMFQNDLKRIESSLDDLREKLDRVKESSNQIGIKRTAIEALVEKMKGFEEVINECSNIQWWNCCMINHYAGRLEVLEGELLKQFPNAITFELQQLSLMVETETYILVKDIKKAQLINSMPGNPGVSCAVPRPPDSIFGFKEPLENLKQALLQGTDRSLLVTAPGGCGKTTLVKMLCHDEEIKGKFKDNIFFVCITKTPNKMDIVDTLLRRFNYKYPFRGNDDAIEDAIQQLELQLNEITDPKLLILDDVWLGSDHVINAFMFENIPNFKILVTSRATISRLLYKLPLEPLNNTDARALFCHHSAVPQERNLNDLLEDSIEKIVEVCGGFPIALKMIGESLRGQDASTWVNKANDWTCSHSVLDSNTDLLKCLEKTLDFSGAEPNLRDCFMDLGAFPVQKIPIAALIDIWAELHSLDEKKSIEIIIKIIARNLATLELPWKNTLKFDKYYSYNFMSQHGLLTELAIKQCNRESIEQRQRMIIDFNGNNHLKQWPEQTQQPNKARLLSIATDDTSQSSWWGIQAPEVEVLILNFQSRNYKLPGFVQTMKKLKVLIVTNHGHLPVELGNFQLLDSLPYLKKIRLEKVSIPSLDQTNPIKLRSLKKISLFTCEIGEAFNNYATGVSDLLPNLEEVNIACCKGMEEFLSRLCAIVSLKKLSITGSFKELPQGICNLENLEVLRLRYCVDLSKLPDSITRLLKLRVLDIADSLRIGNLPERIGELRNLQELHMKGCFGLRNRLPQSITALQQLRLVTCDKEIAQLLQPIKNSTLTNLKVAAAAEDFDLSWITNHYF